MSKFEVVPNVPGQWYVRRVGDYTNPPVALFYDVELAEQFAASAAPAEGRLHAELIKRLRYHNAYPCDVQLRHEAACALHEQSVIIEALEQQLATAPTMSEAERDVLTKACSRYDTVMERIGGCTDGACIIKPPVGMHTNGGCRCSTDKLKMQRAMDAANNFRRAIAEIERIDRAAAKGENE